MIVFVDMDNTLCDYAGAFQRALEANPEIKYPQSQVGFFLGLEPLKNAVKYYKKLEEYGYDVRVLTSPSVKNPLSYTEKRMWVEKYLGNEAAEKMILAPDKSLVGGERDFLIDDIKRHERSRQQCFSGKLIHFGSYEYPDWKTLYQKFIKDDIQHIVARFKTLNSEKFTIMHNSPYPYAVLEHFLNHKEITEIQLYENAKEVNCNNNLIKKLIVKKDVTHLWSHDNLIKNQKINKKMICLMSDNVILRNKSVNNNFEITFIC